MTTREAFMLGIHRLGSAFGRVITDDVLEIYWDALKGYDAPLLAQGMSRAATECEFFPPPAKVRALVPSGRDMARETTLRLEAMKPDPACIPTAGQLEALRASVRELAESKALPEDLGRPTTRITDAEKAEALARMEAQLNARQGAP